MKIDLNSDKYQCIEFHLIQWGSEFKEILKQIQNGTCDAYTFYYYMKDFEERISKLANYAVKH